MTHLFIGMFVSFALVFSAVAAEEENSEGATTEEAACGVEGAPGSEPLSRHTEVRLARYILHDRCPVTHDEDQLARCHWLREKARCEKTRILERRQGLRSRSVRSRLQLRTKEQATENDVTSTEETTFDAEGVGFKALDPHTEKRVRGYALNDNCDEVALTQDEFDRCSYLLRQRDDVRQNAVRRRRLATSAERVASRRIDRDNRRLSKRSERLYGHGRSGGIVTKHTEERVMQEEEMIDLSGHPGKEPLSDAHEIKVARYVEYGSCRRLGTDDLRNRCDYLEKKTRQQRQSILSRSRSRLRSAGVLRNTPRFRGVDLLYRKQIQDATSYSATRLQQGSRSRPRTIDEASDLGESEVITGDDDACQRNAKLCPVEESSEEESSE